MQGSAARAFTASIQGTWTTQRVNWEYTVSILGVYKDLQHTSIQRVYTEYTENIQGTASIQGVYRDLQHARPLKLFYHLPCLVPCATGQHWFFFIRQVSMGTHTLSGTLEIAYYSRDETTYKMSFPGLARRVFKV